MKYITLDRFDDTMEFVSPTYGKYTIRKIAVVDCITALKNKDLKTALDECDRVKKGLGMRKSVKLDTIFVDKYQEFSLSEYYTAFLEDNEDWVDPRGLSEKLPIALKKESFYKKFSI